MFVTIGSLIPKIDHIVRSCEGLKKDPSFGNKLSFIEIISPDRILTRILDRVIQVLLFDPLINELNSGSRAIESSSDFARLNLIALEFTDATNARTDSIIEYS